MRVKILLLDMMLFACQSEKQVSAVFDNDLYRLGNSLVVLKSVSLALEMHALPRYPLKCSLLQKVEKQKIDWLTFLRQSQCDRQCQLVLTDPSP